MVGYCLNCGTRLTRCGSVFTADIECRACGALNTYENSQQPVRFALATGRESVDNPPYRPALPPQMNAPLGE